MATNHALPYPGHSWSFTQHAIGLEPKNLYNLLAAAALFEGQEDVGDKIADVMLKNKLLTQNVREGKPQPWRDYQQLLAELGLIYSTKIHRTLKITPLGLMLLAGEIGFSDLVTMQALRYQYPNGQKSDIQARLREELDGANISTPDSLIQLQAQSGVLIKPGLLILRLLLELNSINPAIAYLTVDECQNFLIPLRKNSEWSLALTQILHNRKIANNNLKLNSHSRRNIQDWFKFLSQTNVFEINNGYISLINGLDLNHLSNYVIQNEKIENFWIPTKFDLTERLKWFGYYGSISLSSEVSLDSDLPKVEDYVGGQSIIDPIPKISSLNSIELKPVSKDKLQNATGEIKDLDKALQNIRQGSIRRFASHKMHEQMVIELSTYFESCGAQVFEDGDSVDILVKWPDKRETILEVKTVSKQLLNPRIRTAIGQLEEYSYRRFKQSGSSPDKIIVLNADIPSNYWQVDFLNNYLDFSLLCRTPISYKGHCHTKALHTDLWKNIALSL